MKRRWIPILRQRVHLHGLRLSRVESEVQDVKESVRRLEQKMDGLVWKVATVCGAVSVLSSLVATLVAVVLKYGGK